jgi:hypothetical protein
MKLTKKLLKEMAREVLNEALEPLPRKVKFKDAADAILAAKDNCHGCTFKQHMHNDETGEMFVNHQTNMKNRIGAPQIQAMLNWKRIEETYNELYPDAMEYVENYKTDPETTTPSDMADWMSREINAWERRSHERDQAKATLKYKKAKGAYGDPVDRSALAGAGSQKLTPGMATSRTPTSGARTGYMESMKLPSDDLKAIIQEELANVLKEKKK